MNGLAFLLEFSLLLGFFACIFRLVYHGKKDFKFGRACIINSVLASLIIPMLPDFWASGMIFYGVVLETVTIGVESVASEQVGAEVLVSRWKMLVAILWLIGSLYYLVQLIGSIIAINRKKLNAKRCIIADVPVYSSQDIQVPFSYAGEIFLPSHLKLGSDVYQTIFDHEKAHIQLHHTRDKLGLLLMRICFWWHPAIHYFLNQLNLIHEYQVDQKIAQKNGVKAYASLLNAYKNRSFNMLPANTISSQIKQRITMMYSMDSTLSTPIKVLSLVALVLGSVLIHSCTSEVTAVNEKEEQTTTMNKDSENSYNTIITDTIVTFDLETKTEKVSIVNQEKTVYLEPQTLPLFPGCEHISDYNARLECSNQKLLTYVYTNIKYPKEAKESGVEGMVVVEFIVDEKGYALKEKIVKSVGYGMDKEVLDLIKEMREDDSIRFQPGTVDDKPVSVAYKLPVKFKLE